MHMRYSYLFVKSLQPSSLAKLAALVLFATLFHEPVAHARLVTVPPAGNIEAASQTEKNGTSEKTASPAANVTGRGVPVKPQTFTGISKPMPGESRYNPDNAPKSKKPVPGTAVRLVIPSAWCHGVSRARIDGPLENEKIETVPDNQSGGSTPVPTPAPPEPQAIRFFQDVAPTLNWNNGITKPNPLYAADLSDLMENADDHGNDTTPDDDLFKISEPEKKVASEKIFFSATCPNPSRYQPVAAGDDVAPENYYNPYGPVGPPKSLRYGLVSDAGILNTPYAPAQALPKVWSNGREVTATERAQLAEGRAPIIRSRHVMAKHTNVATSLPVYCDGLEHCPVCMRPYLCGCGEEDCRFCNPESRIGPAPVCSCCGDARPCIHGNVCHGQLGHSPYREFGNTSGGIACPICKEAVERVPCGCCEKCKRGETCELYKPCGKCVSCQIGEKCDLYKAHRDCVLPNKLNSCNRCDNRINGEPCGTCDWCRENSGLNHEPCGHQEVGIIRSKTVYNPYNEPKLFSAPTRFITNRFNNNASRFPIYYNPAPHYKSTSNPSLYAGYARPFTMRYTCAECMHDPCTCTAAGKAGQTAYAFACKFCNRNPCACAYEICNSNMDLNPKEIHSQREKLRESEKPKPLEDEAEVKDTAAFKPTPDVKVTPTTPDTGTAGGDWQVPRAPGSATAPDNSTELLPDAPTDDKAGDSMKSELERLFDEKKTPEKKSELERLFDETPDATEPALPGMP